jgi:hypothetical protein
MFQLAERPGIYYAYTVPTSNLKMEASYSSETSVSTTERYHNPEYYDMKLL